MKKVLLIALAILFPLFSLAQSLTLLDRSTLQPIVGASIVSEEFEQTMTTGKSGKADIGVFKGAAKVTISHIGYATINTSYSEIEKQKFVVYLTQIFTPLTEIVISASKFEEKARDVAQPVHAIQRRDITYVNQPTSADLLQQSGQVMVQKSQLGGGSPVIRGFETNKVLIVVDGVRMNNAIYRGGHLQNVITLDQAVMDRVEIVMGPGSVVYGSDALGGVMHFHTRKPTLSESESLRVNVQAYTRYATAAKEETGHFDLNLGWKKFGSLTSVTFSDFDDLRQGKQRNPFYGDWGLRKWYVERINGVDTVVTNKNPNIQKQSGYKQYDLLQKFLYRQSDQLTHQLNIQYSTSSDIPRYDRLTQEQNGLPRFAQWYYGPQERLFASYTLDLSLKNKMMDEGRVILGYQNIEESRHDRRFRKNTLNHRTETVDILTINTDFAKHSGEHEIRYGLEGYSNDVKSKAYSEDITDGTRDELDTRYPDGGSVMNGYAAYVTHAWEINEKFILNDGLRFSYINLESKFNDTTFFPFPFREAKQNNGALNGNIGLVYMPCKGWRFNLLGSSGFRAPNVDDLSKVFESNPGQVIVPNPNLKPEYIYNIEAGITKDFEPGVTIGAGAYHTWYVDAITTQPGMFNGEDSILYNGQLSEVKMNVNAAEAYLYGGHAFLQADVTPSFSIYSSLNYTFGRIRTDSADYPLDHIPPVFGKTSFNLKLKKFRGEFFVMYHGAKKSEDYNLLGEDNHAQSADKVNGYMPAWYTLNIRGGYQFSRQIGLHLSLENILDHHYRVFASNISAPGRNFIVSLKGNF
jgi:hemoglobin/transferrin/lactoferrin receptor protein